MGMQCLDRSALSVISSSLKFVNITEACILYSNMDFHNRLANEAANYDGAQLASASIGLGPNGGFQAGQISPVSFSFLDKSSKNSVANYLTIS